MQAFREYLKEQMEGEQLLPAIISSEDGVDFLNISQRDAVNFILSDITDEFVPCPEVVYERVRQVLVGLGYRLPPVSVSPELFDDTEGEEIFGMTRPLPPDAPTPAICYLYFAFCQDEETQIYDVLAEIMTEAELESILHDEETDAPTSYSS